MKKQVGLILFVGALIMLTGCEQSEQTANKSAKKSEEAKGYVETLASVNRESKKDIADAVNKENKKLDGALSMLEDESGTKEGTNDNSQVSTTMDNIPNQINMDFAKTCKKATIKTNKGDITIAFYNADAPVTVANFCTLADKGSYNDVIFHRVIKDFMIQGGDPDGTGFGGPDYKFDDEIHANNKNNSGTIAMANSGPGTNGSQFFINTKDNNFLDTKHTVFGEVIEGMETVTKIEGAEVGAQDRPVEEIVIESVVLENN